MRPIITALFVFFYSTYATAQDEKPGRISPKELSIPAAPIFDMMGVTPSQINRTSDIKDFKVDWSFKSWRLNPNLAIQSQPIWELFYNRKDLEKYQSAPRFMRRLASLDVSIGSVQNEENDRRIGFAVKMNLFNNRDPLMARELYGGISEKFAEEKAALEKQLQELELKLDTTQNILEKPAIRGEIKSAQDQLMTVNSRRREEINGRAKIFVDEHWNASALDIAYGRVYTYRTDSVGGLKGLKLNRNTGWAAWINGSHGIGKKFLLSYLLRSTWYEEELEFQIRNTTTLEENTQKAVAANTLYSLGMNFRYGGSIYTFFLEFLYEKKSLKTPVEALGEVFKAPGNFEVVGSSVKWDVVHPNSLSIGGDWRISRSVIINYGMRCVFSDEWEFKTFTPVVSVACMMR